VCPVGVALFAYAAPARNQRHFYFVSFSESLFRRPNSPRGLSEESQATSRRSRIRRLAVSFCIHRDTDVVSRWCFRTWGGSGDLRFRCWSCPAWHWCDRSDRCRRRRRAVPGAVKITHRVPPSVAARSIRVTRCLPTEARDGRGFVHPGHHHPYPRRPVFHDGRGDAVPFNREDGCGDEEEVRVRNFPVYHVLFHLPDCPHIPTDTFFFIVSGAWVPSSTSRLCYAVIRARVNQPCCEDSEAAVSCRNTPRPPKYEPRTSRGKPGRRPKTT
jgi:hypothetical protein